MSVNFYSYNSGYEEDGGSDELEKTVKRVGAIPWNETSNIPIHMIKYVLKCVHMGMDDIEQFVDESAGALMYTAYPYFIYVFFHDEESIKSAIRNWTKRKLVE